MIRILLLFLATLPTLAGEADAPGVIKRDPFAPERMEGSRQEGDVLLRPQVDGVAFRDLNEATRELVRAHIMMNLRLYDCSGDEPVELTSVDTVHVDGEQDGVFLRSGEKGKWPARLKVSLAPRFRAPYEGERTVEALAEAKVGVVDFEISTLVPAVGELRFATRGTARSAVLLFPGSLMLGEVGEGGFNFATAYAGGDEKVDFGKKYKVTFWPGRHEHHLKLVGYRWVKPFEQKIIEVDRAHLLEGKEVLLEEIPVVGRVKVFFSLGDGKRHRFLDPAVQDFLREAGVLAMREEVRLYHLPLWEQGDEQAQPSFDGMSADIGWFDQDGSAFEFRYIKPDTAYRCRDVMFWGSRDVVAKVLVETEPGILVVPATGSAQQSVLLKLAKKTGQGNAAQRKQNLSP